MRERASTLVLVCALLAAACASARVDPRPDYARARELIADSTGRAEVFDPEAPLTAEADVEAILADGLALDEALRLALLESRRLHAEFATLGVARADVVQAGLLRNPRASAAFLLPAGGGRTKIAAGLAASWLDVWELPQRARVAGAALDERVFEVSRYAGELVADAEIAYLESVAARDRVETARAGADVARRALEAVREQVRAGAASATDASLAEGRAMSADLALQLAELDAVGRVCRLAALLSIERDLAGVELVDALPEPGGADLDREALVVASASRLDLRAARAAVEGADARVALERRRASPEVEAGVSVERPERGASVDLLAGPGLEVELPTFDRNAAAIRRAELDRDRLAHERDALAAEVAQAVRAAVDRAAAAVRTARFVAGELVPQAERAAALARTAYELGDTTVLPLLESERAALLARQSRIDALLAAAVSRIEVERAVGAPLGRAAVTAPAASGSAR